MNETNTTDTTEQQAPTPQLDLNDLNAVVQIIDVCAKRGSFEGIELADVGTLRNRIVQFLNANTPKPETTTEPKV